MSLKQLYCGAHKLVDSFNILHTKLFLDSFDNDDPDESEVIQKQVEDLQHGLGEAKFLVLLLKYLDNVEQDRQQLMLENEMLRDELNYINDKLKIVDQTVISPEEQHRQDQFDNEIHALNELLENDLEFSTADVSTLMREEEFISHLSNDNIALEIPIRTNVAAAYFTKYLTEGNFDVAVPTCQRFIKELQYKHTDRLEVAAMLEIQAMAFRNDLQFIDAANMLKATLSIYDEMLPVDNPLILITLRNLAQLYDMIDLYSDERNPVKQLMNMATKSESLKYFDTAIKLYREILEIYEQLSDNVSFFEECSISAGMRLANDSLHQGQFNNLKLQENIASHRNEISAPAEEQTHSSKIKNRDPTNCMIACSCESCEGLEGEERAGMMRDLVLDGLPDMSFNNNKEKLKAAVCKISRALDVFIQEADILTCYRIGRKEEKRGPRTVIVTYKLKATRDALYHAYMKKRNLVVKDIFPDTNSQARIYISERLTAACKYLFRRCAALKKRNIIARFFTMNGRPYIKQILSTDSELATLELIESLEQ